MGNAWDDLNGGWAGADKPKKGAMNPHETNAEWAKFSVYDPGNDADERLILGNWLDHLRALYREDKADGRRRLKSIAKLGKHGWRAKRDQVADLIKRCPPIIIRSIHDQPCYGFICAEYQGSDQVLHFLYIRDMWRRRGFATTLMRVSFNRLGKDPIFYTHPMLATFFYRDKWKLIYKPKMIVRREDDHPSNAPSPRGNPRILGA